MWSFNSCMRVKFYYEVKPPIGHNGNSMYMLIVNNNENYKNSSRTTE